MEKNNNDAGAVLPPSADAVAKEIRARFHVKQRDTLPFVGWHNTTRIDLAELFKDLGYKKGAEVGVCKGHYSRVLLKAIQNLELYCVDPWYAYNRLSTEKAEMRLDICKKNLAPWPNAIFVRKTSMEAVHIFEDESLDFVYIDGMHDFDWVMEDLINWSKKVRIGGIVSGHDYCNFYRAGIIEAVNSYTRGHQITEWYVTREKEPSFFWVKKNNT